MGLYAVPTGELVSGLSLGYIQKARTVAAEGNFIMCLTLLNTVFLLGIWSTWLTKLVCLELLAFNFKSFGFQVHCFSMCRKFRKKQKYNGFDLKLWKLCQFEGLQSLAYGILLCELDVVPVFLCVGNTIYKHFWSIFVGTVNHEHRFSLTKCEVRLFCKEVSCIRLPCPHN